MLAEAAPFLEQQPLPAALEAAHPLLLSEAEVPAAEVVVALASPHLACSVAQDFFFLPKRPPASTGLLRASKRAAPSRRVAFFIE